MEIKSFISHKHLVFLPLCLLGAVILPLQIAHGQPKAAIRKPFEQKNKRQARAEYLKIAKQLGWVQDDASPTLCPGYYQDPFLDSTQQNLGAQQIGISADKVLYKKQGRSVLSGNVHVQQGEQHLVTNKAVIHRTNAQGPVNSIDFPDHVTLHEPGKLLIAEGGGRIFPQNKTGYLKQCVYRMSLSNQQANQAGTIQRLHGTNAWGKAAQINRDAKGTITIKNGTYATCPPTVRAWELQAKKLVLNKQTGKGKAYDVTMRLHGIPLFTLPYYSFPIDNRRKSGFLTPVPALTNNNGFYLALPYYFNLAPNYDATITPQIYTRRGFMLSGEFRYLDNYTHLLTSASFLPNDRIFKNFQQANPGKAGSQPNRSSYHFYLDRQLNTHWHTAIDFNGVSDDYYLQDFFANLPESTNNQLLRQGHLTYRDNTGFVDLSVLGYQTLHPINRESVSDLYRRLPELAFDRNYISPGGSVHFDINGQFDNFDWPGMSIKAEGQRYHLRPGLQIIRRATFGYVIPSIYVDVSQYELHNQPFFNGQQLNDKITRLLPMVSIDTGLYFDRDIQWLGHDFTQSLEPRLFYLYVPISQQNYIPNFDTSYYVFNYDQLFRLNRFSGLDRIQNANQLSFALSSSLTDDETGDEIMRASIGDIVYFQNRKTQLCQGPGCEDQPKTCIGEECKDTPFAVGYLPLDARFSPIAGELRFHLAPSWYLTGDTSWDPTTRQSNNANVYFTYNPHENKIFHIGYSFIERGDSFISKELNEPLQPILRRNLHQVYASGAWPVNKHWQLLGTWGYNISQDYPMIYFAGIEYHSCCWAVRAMAARTFSNLSNNLKPQYHTSFALQILFTGLGSAGVGDGSEMIRNHIPNYDDIFKT